MRKTWCRNRKQSEEDPGVKDVSNGGGGFCFRQGGSTGSQISIRTLAVLACETCACVSVCVCVYVCIPRLMQRFLNPKSIWSRFISELFFPAMFPFLKSVMSFSSFKGKCHNVTRSQLVFNLAWLRLQLCCGEKNDSEDGECYKVKSGLLLSFLTVTNDVFVAADAGDCAFFSPQIQQVSAQSDRDTALLLFFFILF